MAKRKLPAIVEEKWEFLEDLMLNGHRLKVRGQEFFMFAAFGNLLFTPEEMETALSQLLLHLVQVVCQLLYQPLSDLLCKHSLLKVIAGTL